MKKVPNLNIKYFLFNSNTYLFYYYTICEHVFFQTNLKLGYCGGWMDLSENVYRKFYFWNGHNKLGTKIVKIVNFLYNALYN